MPLFKSKDPVDPPAEGDPPAGGEPTYITQEQFTEGMKPFQETMETVNKTLDALNKQPTYQPPAAPAAAPEDPHKASKERITAIDGELQVLVDKAEEATMSGKGMGAVTAKQNQLMIERGDLQAKVNVAASDPRVEAGLLTLDALSTEITSGKMEHLKLPAVKERYDHYIGAMLPEQRMNPEAKMGAYNLAVGENQAIIQDAQKQVWLREVEEGEAGGAGSGTQAPAAGAGTGRQQPGGGGDGALKPEDVFSPEALKSIRTSRHRTVENYVVSLGYGGWADYTEKNKDHFGLEEEGE